MASQRTQLLDTVIVGGGVSGLGLAWRLTQAGRPPLVLEAGAQPGGLASGQALAGQAIERYYHYLCPADTELLALARSVGVPARFSPAGQAVWREGWQPLNHPRDLLSLSLPWGAKARLAWGSLGLGRREPDLQLDGEEARAWLRQRFGATAAAEIFEPLVEGKFGAQPLSAAWMRHRLWRARQGSGWSGPRAGIFEGGYAAFFNALAQSLRQRGCQLRFGCALKGLSRERGAWTLRLEGGGRLRARRVLAAVPAPRLLQALSPSLRRSPWARSLAGLRWRSLLQAVFALRRPVSPWFWNNLAPQHAPFNGLVQMERLRPLPYSLAYLPAYVDAQSPWLRLSDRTVLARAWDRLRQLEPQLQPADRLDAAVSREAWAQPILPPGSALTRPSMHAPVPGLHWLDACHLHPSDRSLDACLRAGQRLLEGLPAHA